ncbi:MAG: DUF6282 family protein [Lachnospiraceae bacterium]
MDRSDMLIKGAIDFHVHTAPDILSRKYTDIQLAEECRKAGMSGFVSKCHQGDTSARASAVTELFPDLKVFGGIVLNHAVGGLNEEAVYACGEMGGKIVWFPTVDAYNDADYKRLHFVEHLGGENKQSGHRGKIHIINENHELIKEVYLILEQIKEQEMILATGHLSPIESLILLRIASKMGIRKMIVNHISFPITRASLELQKEYVNCGAMLEHCYYTPYYGLGSWEEILASIKRTGVEHIVLSTDLGQKKSPDPAEGMRSFVRKLYESGISEEEIRQMIVANPRELLGI